MSLLFKKVKVRGGGRLFEGDAYLLFWPRGWALIRGRALIRACALIRGNTVCFSTLALCSLMKSVACCSGKDRFTQMDCIVFTGMSASTRLH